MPPSPRLLAGAAALASALALGACSGTTAGTSCSGTTCTVTLKGTGASVDVLGQHLVLTSTEGGRATVSLAGKQFSCTEGQALDAGPLTLTCSDITADSVKLRASLE